MSDEFFDDEQELMDAARAESGPACGDAADAVDTAPVAGNADPHGSDARKDAGATGPSPAAEEPAVCAGPSSAEPRDERPARQAPPFWMVLAIAAVALALGMVIGYLMGSAATLSELSQSAASTPAPQGQGVDMPEGHPELEVDADGEASLVEEGAANAADADPLELANAHFDRGMGMLTAAKDQAAHDQAVEVFRQAIAYYDAYLEDHDSQAAEVDRAICVFYAGDHDEAIADLEEFVKDDPSFAPAWANLGMFYEAHDDLAKAKDAYRAALDAAKDGDPYGVSGYASERLEALGK